jgi:hypothetical protein
LILHDQKPPIVSTNLHPCALLNTQQFYRLIHIQTEEIHFVLGHDALLNLASEGSDPSRFAFEQAFIEETIDNRRIEPGQFDTPRNSLVSVIGQSIKLK